MERLETSVRFRSGADSLTVYPLDGKGHRLRPIPVTKTPSGFEMRLQADGQDLSPWYEFVAAR
jgi:hypothetical protein